jgi:hypothetical protein
MSDDSSATGARDPRREAQAVVGEGFVARVLEPSPPAVDDGVWFADDPVAAATDGGRVVSPVGGGDLTWDDWLRDRPEHRGWAAARWLGSYSRLSSPPPAYQDTCPALHRLVVYVVSPARRRANGKIALRWTFGGLGTPFFGADEQVRIVGRDLVRQRRGAAKVQPATTLNDTAGFVLDGPPDLASGEGFDVPPAGDLDEELPIDAGSAAFLGDWYGFAYSVLEELRADAESVDPDRVQLWPEHFDAAFVASALPEGRGRRTTFGASPGDAAVAEPYLYVLPNDFDTAPPSEFWNADSFRGAILLLSEFVDADDQRAAALAFLRRGRSLMAS